MVWYIGVIILGFVVYCLVAIKVLADFLYEWCEMFHPKRVVDVPELVVFLLAIVWPVLVPITIVLKLWRRLK